jgi:hypothetical protein
MSLPTVRTADSEEAMTYPDAARSIGDARHDRVTPAG